MRQVPAKVDIGPIYNVDPRRRSAYAGHAEPHPNMIPYMIPHVQVAVMPLLVLAVLRMALPEICCLHQPGACSRTFSCFGSNAVCWEAIDAGGSLPDCR